VWALTIVLWTIMLLVFPFFYSGATATTILTQGDLLFALTVFLTIGIGLRLTYKLFARLNYVWAIMTVTWVLAASVSRLISKTKMEIFDAVYTRMFFDINEWWTIVLLVGLGLTTTYYLLASLRLDKLTMNDIGQRDKAVLTGISILIPVLWCLTLNFEN